MLQELIQIISATNWTAIVMIMSFVTIANFVKYDDPNPKAHFNFNYKHLMPQLVLTYKLYGGEDGN